MNVNGRLIEALEAATGYPVKPDIYTGAANKYITFTYEDERSALEGDNEELATVVYMMVTLWTPSDYNYFEDKKKIKLALKEIGFTGISIQSWVSNDKIGTQYVRQTVFSANITEMED